MDATGEPTSVASLEDVVAKILLKRPGRCPTNFLELSEKLVLEDREGCWADPRVGVLSRFTSERAQLLANPESMRAVLTRDCGGRSSDTLFVHLDDLSPDANTLSPHTVDIMAFDDHLGAYNFYRLTDGVWTYHGDSWTVSQAGGSCGSCHADGGLLMLTMQAPWVHWGATLPLPGSGQIVDRFEALGALASGPELEPRIASGNRRWNEHRRTVLLDPARTDRHAGSMAEILRPLFCSRNFNLRSASSIDALGRPTPLSSLPADFFIDPFWGISDTVPVSHEQYERSLTDVRSSVEGVLGADDTYFGLTFVARSVADQDEVRALLRLGVVDEEFVSDVLAVDFSRAVFSSDRCDLLAFAPDLDEMVDELEPAPVDSCCQTRSDAGCGVSVTEACVCDVDTFCCDEAWDQGCVNRAHACGGCPAPIVMVQTARQLSAAFADRLRAADVPEGSVQAQFLRDLETDGQRDARRERVVDFVRACRDRAGLRDEAAFIADVLTVAAARKDRARRDFGSLVRPGVVTTDEAAAIPTAYFETSYCTLSSSE